MLEGEKILFLILSHIYCQHFCLATTTYYPDWATLMDLAYGTKVIDALGKLSDIYASKTLICVYNKWFNNAYVLIDAKQ